MSAGAIWYVSRELQRDVLVVDPIAVPKDFEDNGLTADVMSNRMCDALRRVESATKAKMKMDNPASSHDQGATPEIEIPGTKLTIKTVIDVIRRLSNKYPKHVTGDIAFAQPRKGIPNEQIIGTVYITQGEIRGIGKSYVGDETKVDLLLENMAEAVLSQVNPYLYAINREKHRDYKAALDTIQTILLDPHQKPIYKDACMRLWCLVFYDEGNYEQGATKAREMLQLHPDDADAHYNLGIFLARLHKDDEGIAEFQRAIDLYPNYPKAYNNWGMIRLGEGKYDDAISKFRSAIKIDSEFEDGYVNLGIALSNTHSYEEAISMFRKASTLDPDDKELYEHWGRSYLVQNKCQEAEVKFKRAIDIDPKFRDAYIYDSWALACLGRRGDANRMAKLAAGLSN